MNSINVSDDVETLSIKSAPGNFYSLSHDEIKAVEEEQDEKLTKTQINDNDDGGVSCSKSVTDLDKRKKEFNETEESDLSSKFNSYNVNSPSELEGDNSKDQVSSHNQSPLVSSDEEGNNNKSPVNIETLPSSLIDPSSSSISNRPPISVRIPTAFLASQQKSSSSHHVYQIYIRIKDEEWNVYRRYSQFYALHKFLKKKFPMLRALSKDFPPKITIGNRDAKVVQERRKKLESYLRAIVNVFQAEYNITDKRTLILVLPFLEDKKIEGKNDLKSRSDTHLNSASSSSSLLSHCYVGY